MNFKTLFNVAILATGFSFSPVVLQKAEAQVTSNCGANGCTPVTPTPCNTGNCPGGTTETNLTNINNINQQAGDVNVDSGDVNINNRQVRQAPSLGQGSGAVSANGTVVYIPGAGISTPFGAITLPGHAEFVDEAAAFEAAMAMLDEDDPRYQAIAMVYFVDELEPLGDAVQDVIAIDQAAKTGLVDECNDPFDFVSRARPVRQATPVQP